MKTALHHSKTNFLNSLFREWNEYACVRSSHGEGIEIQVRLDERSQLLFPLERFSPLGRHRYAGIIFLEKDGERRELGFIESARLLIERIARTATSTPESRDRFLARVEASAANIRQALEERREAIERLYSGSLDFKSAEEGLFLGHAFHPTPKSRDEFSEEDQRRYSPEFGNPFAIEWMMADPSIVHASGSESALVDRTRWARELADSELAKSTTYLELAAQGWIPIPMHPWQFEVLRSDPSMEAWWAKGLLVALGAGNAQWSATSSLRSIYRKDAPCMLKFSMSLKLTNSIRHLLPREVERGVQLSRVLETEEGRRFLERHPEFEVIKEPAYLCLKSEDGSPDPKSIVVCRENPFRERETAGIAVLATLTQDHPLGGENLIQKAIREANSAASENESLAETSMKWFKRYLEFAVRPFLDAQANFGVVLGAHQQNLLLRLEGGHPAGAIFRDCQGTGYTELGWEIFSREVGILDRSNGNVVSERMGNALLAYYLVLNSTFNAISAICDRDWIAESTLIAELEDFLRAFRSPSSGDRAPFDLSLLSYLLDSETLLHKGNFLCSIEGLNENTTEDPLAIYAPVPNPIRDKSARGLPFTDSSRSAIGSLLPPLAAVSYRPLRSDSSYTASFDGERCAVSREGKTVFQCRVARERAEFLFVDVSESSDPIGILVAFEYLFGHFPALGRGTLKPSLPIETPLDLASFKRDDGSLSLARSEFFSLSGNWHAPELRDPVPETWIETAGRKHPKRPTTRPGTHYRKHFPSAGKTISFRTIDAEKDLDLFHGWQNQYRVAALWELAKPKAELREYLEKAIADPHTLPMILEFDGEAAGYFEMYWAAEDRIAPYYDCDPYDRGFHFLIGERRFLGRANTEAVVSAVSHFLFVDEPRTKRVVAEPRSDNRAVIKYSQIVPGWRFVKEFDFPHKRAALVWAEREGYFEGGAP